MLKTIFFASAFIVMLLGTSILLIPYYILKITKNRNIIEKYMNLVVSNWARSIIFFTGSKVEIYGQENLKKLDRVLFVSNHESMFDIPILISKLPRVPGFIAKIELVKYPILSTWMRLMHCIFMDRKNRKQSLKAINQGIKNIKNGYPMVIFPEGTRSKSRKMRKFKKGSFRLAIKSNANIVPVTIIDSYKIFEANNNNVKKARVKLIIHPPLACEELSEKEKKNIHNITQEMIEKELVK